MFPPQSLTDTQMSKTEPSKPTIWILDDQWRSALTKISWFFSFTEAAFPAPKKPDALTALDASAAATGWRLERLQPSDLAGRKLKNGIVLIDVNWSAAPASETGLAGLSPSEKENYGITLAEEILARRKPHDNLEIILFSHTRGNRLTAYFFDLTKRQVERVHPVVILDDSEDGPLIRTYGWDACRRVTGQLLQQIPGTNRKVIADRIERRLEEADLVQPEDFTAGIDELEVDGIRVRDLAVPFYQRSEAQEARAEEADVSRAGLEPLRDWNALVQSRRIAFEIGEELSNQPSALIRALLRYGKVDHLDGFLFLPDSRGSRYGDPASSLKKTISQTNLDPDKAALFNAFKRIVSVGLGTPIRKLANGEALEDIESSAFKNLPCVFHDRSVFDVEGGSHTPEAKLSIFGSGETGFRIKVAADVIWDNRLIHAAGRLDTFRRGEAAEPATLFEILQTDPGNFQTVLEIARRQDALLAKHPKTDPIWTLVRDAARDHCFLLKRASNQLEAYSEFVQGQIAEFSGSAEKAFARELKGSNPRMRLWDEWRESLEALLREFEAEESFGSRLAHILETTDTAEGEDALEEALSPYYARARGYANKALEQTLKRRGIYDSAHLKMIETGFAKLFPGSTPAAQRNTWTAIGITALDTLRDQLTTITDRRLETRLVPAMGKELVQRITGLEGYETLEQLDVLPEDD